MAMGDIASDEHHPPIRVVRGKLPRRVEPEYGEMMSYESGAAEAVACTVQGPYEEAWRNVVAAFEPGCEPALRWAMRDSGLAPRIFGRVLDLGAGSCWASALLSRQERITEVVALDLSEDFLVRVGVRVMTQLGANLGKVTLAVSTFEDVPFEDAHFDVVFMIAALHHSLAPLRALIEARRVLKANGLLVVVECPPPLISILSARRAAIEETRRSGASEIAHTRGEIAYLMQHAGFESPTFHAVAGLSTNPLKRCGRLILRRLGVEHVFRGTLYVISAQRG